MSLMSCHNKTLIACHSLKIYYNCYNNEKIKILNTIIFAQIYKVTYFLAKLYLKTNLLKKNNS